MTPAGVGDRGSGLPLGQAARDRLRDQQREESRCLAHVLATQQRLAVEQERAAAAIEKAQRRVAERNSAVDNAIGALVAASGVTRTATLLGLRAREVSRLARARRAAQTATTDIAAARQLAERLLARELPQRWQHTQAVAAEAERLAHANAIDDELIVAAAWLNGIGYASNLGDVGFHPLDGARYLRANGWPEPVCALVAHHTDAIRQAADLGLADQLRAEFADEPGIARDIIWAADATTGPSGQRLTLDERLAEISDRYGADSSVTKAMQASREALAAAITQVRGNASTAVEPR